MSFDLYLCSALISCFREARSKYNVEFLVGFEAEFILLKSTRPIEAVNHHAWSSADGFPAGKVGTIAVEEIADAVQASGLELQMYHAEAAPGQVGEPLY
jgi:glutamine synthetase